MQGRLYGSILPLARPMLMVLMFVNLHLPENRAIILCCYTNEYLEDRIMNQPTYRCKIKTISFIIFLTICFGINIGNCLID